MTTTNSSTPCVPGALAGGLTRTSLVDGMILNHDDLASEQRYWRLKRRLTNRALGAGVVWGLKLCYDSELQQFTLSPGYALDCCGNDIIVQEQQVIRARDLFDTSAPAFIKTLAKALATGVNEAKNQKAYANAASGSKIKLKQADVTVILKYVECAEQPRAVLADACSTTATDCQTSRVRETCLVDTAPPVTAPTSAPIAKFLADLQAAMSDPTQSQAVLANVFPGNAPQKVEAAPPTQLGPAPVDTPTFNVQPAPLALHIRLGHEERIVRLEGSGTIDVPAIEAVFPYGGTTPRGALISFELRPDPGYVLLTGSETFAPTNEVMPGGSGSITPPFALDLAWSLSAPLPGAQAFTKGTKGVKVGSSSSSAGTPPTPNSNTYFIGDTQVDATYGKLFGGDRGGVHLTLSGRKINNQTQDAVIVVTELVNSATPPMEAHVALQGIQLTWNHVDAGGGTASGGTTAMDGGTKDSSSSNAMSCGDGGSKDDTSGNTVSSCLDSLAPGVLFLDSTPDQGADPKTLLMAAMYAWLKLSLDGQDATQAKSFEGGQTLAAWLYLTAWRLLFGANPAAPDPDGGDRAYLGQLLDSLFHQWCDGFFYPGPRCTESHHGVVLGTATVNSNGSVQCFSAWKGRRHVLTGPLLTHWKGQLGIAPVDVIASRFLQAICCFSKKPSVELGPMSALNIPELIFSQGSTQPSFSDGSPGPVGGVMLSDGYYLFYGDSAGADQYFDAAGVRRKQTQGVGGMTLLGKLIGAFMRSMPPGPEREYEHYYVNGSQPTLHLVISVEPSTRIHEEEAVRARIDLEIKDADENSKSPYPALARRPALEWLSEAMWTLPLAGLPNVPVNSPAHAALLAARIPTAGRAIALGAEKVRAALDPTTLGGAAAADTFVNKMFGDVDFVVSQMVAVLLAFTLKWPAALTRSLLKNDGGFINGFVTALNTALTSSTSTTTTGFKESIDVDTYVISGNQLLAAALAIP
jgi:hypothetical protein